MAAGTLAALTVSLGLDASEFVSGLTKSQYQLAQMEKSIQAFGDSAKRAFELVGIGAGIASLVEFTKSTIGAAESIRNLSVDTGSSVEEISRLSNIAKISGADFGTFQTALLRLAAGLNGSEDGSTKTAQALQFLGISSRDPAAALQEVADKLAKYADGSGKAAIARDLFGRGGAAYLSTLKDIATATDVTNTLTTKQADEATNLAAQFRQLEVESTGLKNAFLNDVVPSANQVVTALTEARRVAGSGLFNTLLAAAPALNPLGDLNKALEQARSTIEDTQKKIDAAKAQIANPNQADGFLSSLTKDYHPDATLAVELKNLDAQRQQLSVLKGVQRAGLGDLNDPTNFDARDIRARQLPPLPYPDGVGEDPTKKQLEAANKAIEAAIAEQKAQTETYLSVLGEYYQAGYVTAETYYAETAKLRNDNVDSAIAAYQKEIAADQAYINAKDATGKQLHSASNVADVTKQQIEAQKKLGLATEDAGRQAVTAIFAQQRAAEDYRHELDSIAAQLLTLQGNTAGAFRLTSTDSHEDQVRKLSAGAASIDPLAAQLAQAALDQNAAIDAQGYAQAKLNDLTKQYTQITDALGISQAKVDLQQQTGTISEIDALAQKSELTRVYIDSLSAVVDKEKAIAAAALANGTPGADVLTLQVQKASLALLQLGATSDLVKQKLDGIVADNLTTFLDNTISRTKSVKDAFSDMAQGIEKSLLHLVDEDIAKRLLAALIPDSAPGAPAGDIISAFLKFFSPSSPNAPDAPGPGDFPDIPAAAGGSDYTPGGRILVGERGPEIVNLPRGSQVIPNNALGAGGSKKTASTVHNHFNITVPMQTSRATADQIALQASRQMARSRARLGG